MQRARTRNNPLLAAPSWGATGPGRRSLRRWVGVLGWVGLAVVASVLPGPGPAVSTIGSGILTKPLSVLPIVLIGAASVLDAYLTRTDRVPTNGAAATREGGTGGENTTLARPECGREADPDLGFCHWCTTEFVDVDATELNHPDDTDTN